jgi:hypothetical protein
MNTAVLGINILERGPLKNGREGKTNFRETTLAMYV